MVLVGRQALLIREETDLILFLLQLHQLVAGVEVAVIVPLRMKDVQVVREAEAVQMVAELFPAQAEPQTKAMLVGLEMLLVVNVVGEAVAVLAQ